jgi:hypothetical protein
MPGEFYQKGKAEKLDIKAILNRLDDPGSGLAAITAIANAVKTQINKLNGEIPTSNAVTNDWQLAESEVVSIGAANTRYKLHSLLLSIHNLVGTVITVRMYTPVNGVERKVYEQTFNALIDPPGLWIVNGTIGIHDVLRVTLQSNDAADNGQAVDYDVTQEAM